MTIGYVPVAEHLLKQSRILVHEAPLSQAAGVPLSQQGGTRLCNMDYQSTSKAPAK